VTAQSQYRSDGSVTSLWSGQPKIRWFDSPYWQDIKAPRWFLGPAKPFGQRVTRSLSPKIKPFASI